MLVIVEVEVVGELSLLEDRPVVMIRGGFKRGVRILFISCCMADTFCVSDSECVFNRLMLVLNLLLPAIAVGEGAVEIGDLLSNREMS